MHGVRKAGARHGVVIGRSEAWRGRSEAWRGARHGVVRAKLKALPHAGVVRRAQQIWSRQVKGGGATPSQAEGRDGGAERGKSRR